MEPLKLSRLLFRAKILLSWRLLSTGVSGSQKTATRKEEFSSRLGTGPNLKEFIASTTPAVAVPPTIEEDVPHYITDCSSPPVNNKEKWIRQD